MQIIPAIDIIDGKCVRLTQGDYTQQKIYNEHPLEVAKQFEAAGLKRLHLVDLDGARMGKVQNWAVLEEIASRTRLLVDFGGGIKTAEEADRVFAAGASFVTIGSMAVKDEETFIQWLKKYGPDKFLLGADVKGEQVVVSGWTEETVFSVFDLVEKYLSHDVTQVFCTDVSRDGLLRGPSLELYESIIKKYPAVGLIASGGVAYIKDLYDLAQIGCRGAIVGKAIYEGFISLADLKKFSDRK